MRGDLCAPSRLQRQRTVGIAWAYLHVAVDDRTRITYAELLPDEREGAAVAFLARAAAWFGGPGIPRPHRADIVAKNDFHGRRAADDGIPYQMTMRPS